MQYPTQEKTGIANKIALHPPFSRYSKKWYDLVTPVLEVGTFWWWHMCKKWNSANTQPICVKTHRNKIRLRYLLTCISLNSYLSLIVYNVRWGVTLLQLTLIFTIPIFTCLWVVVDKKLNCQIFANLAHHHHLICFGHHCCKAKRSQLLTCTSMRSGGQ